MEQVEHFIHEYRDWFYLITIALTFFEGETPVLLAAAASANGELDPFKLGACAWLGSCLGDQFYFFLGRKCGPFVLRRWPKAKHGIDMIHRWLERWDTLFILTYRFLYGIRNVSSISLGLSDVPTGRFIVLNFFAAGIWAVTYVGVGHIFGRTLGALLGDYAKNFELIAAGIFLVVVVLVAIVARWRRRRARRAALLPGERP